MNEKRVGKIAIFSQSVAVSQKRCKIRSRLLWQTNRKLHMQLSVKKLSWRRHDRSWSRFNTIPACDGRSTESIIASYGDTLITDVDIGKSTWQNQLASNVGDDKTVSFIR